VCICIYIYIHIYICIYIYMYIYIYTEPEMMIILYREGIHSLFIRYVQNVGKEQDTKYKVASRDPEDGFCQVTL
jgi:hypothetical protein